MSFVAQSPTMRRQCAAIADAPHVRVVLQYAPSPSTFSRALSTINRYEAGFVRVAVEIPVTTDVAELLAHELEHTLEAIEGLDLLSQVKVRGSGVTELVNESQNRQRVMLGTYLYNVANEDDRRRRDDGKRFTVLSAQVEQLQAQVNQLVLAQGKGQ